MVILSHPHIQICIEYAENDGVHLQHRRGTANWLALLLFQRKQPFVNQTWLRNMEKQNEKNGSGLTQSAEGGRGYVTVSLPPWTCSAGSHLPSGGSTGSAICSSRGWTGGFGWHLRGGGPAPRHIPAPRSPAWWNGRGGGSRTAGSAGRLSAYWLEGCSAAGWPPKSQWKRDICPRLSLLSFIRKCLGSLKWNITMT